MVILDFDNLVSIKFGREYPDARSRPTGVKACIEYGNFISEGRGETTEEAIKAAVSDFCIILERRGYDII